MTYFSNFPTIDYNGKKIRDITKRTIAIDSIKNNGVPMQAFQLNENERSDFLAAALFQRPEFDYIFFLINDIVDPYHEWYLPQDLFDQFVINKYGGESLSVRYYYYYDRYQRILDTSFKVTFEKYINFTTGERALFEGVESTKTIITPATYDALSASEQTAYTAVTNRDYEAEENAKRKYLNGVLPEYGSLINRQIRASLNDQQVNLS